MGFELESDKVRVPGHRVAFIGPNNPVQGSVGPVGGPRAKEWRKVTADRGAGTLAPTARAKLDRKSFKRPMTKLTRGLLGRRANTKRIPVKKAHGATRKRGTAL
jgi:hypothetical protein